jgi:hypothetical protein
MARRIIPLKPGDVFGRLTILAPARRGAHRVIRWKCRCLCGSECIVRQDNLRSGCTRSCGCYRRELRGTLRRVHGQSGTRLHSVWKAMIQRCHNPKAKDFRNYGARGITVCAAWRKSYADFAAYIHTHLGQKPTPRHTLERISNQKGYAPSNLKWATRCEQNQNTRKNVHLTHNGQTYHISEWARRIGMRPVILTNRLWRGWSVERALTQPLRHHSNR